MINRKDIERLAESHGHICISIFIPTHRAGEAVRKDADVILLKNQWKEVLEKLKDHELSPPEIEQIAQPVQQLIEDQEFWSHQSDGLALFITPDGMEHYTLPLAFEPFNFVSHEFYLKPLMPLFVGDGRFFVLKLALNEVEFFEGARYSITPVIIEDIVPQRLEETVGYDYEQKSLQFRTQQSGLGQGQGTFHGHGEGKDERKNEIQRFLRDVNKGLMTMLHDENPPMVVASQEYLFPMYKEVNDYKNLVDDPITKNLSELTPVFLHELAWEKVAPIFDQERQDKIDLFRQVHGTGKTAVDTSEVLYAALAGKIDTLFLENRTDIWGIYDPAENSVELSDRHHASNTSLMNMAAVKTLLQGGKVYLMEKEQMPDDTAKMNALFRY